MKILFGIVGLLVLISCGAGTKKQENKETPVEEPKGYSLELVWESDTALRTPESVCIDRERNVLYVSNVNQNPWEKDGNGFISKMDMEGNILELKWIEGLNGPKGLGIKDGSLFLSDMDEVVEADIASGEIVNRIKIEGDPQLNDITVGGDGSVYVSGSASNKIYKITDGNVEEFFSGEEERFNGLYWEKDRMLLITSGSSQFKAIDPDTKSITLLAEGMKHGDGIAPVGDGGYITSNWSGTIFYVSAENETTVLLDTEAQNINTADIDFLVKDQILYIPTFFDNRVKAYKLVK